MLANIAAHSVQLHWVALKLQYCANIGRILSYRPIFIQYVNIVPIFSQYCLLVGYHKSSLRVLRAAHSNGQDVNFSNNHNHKQIAFWMLRTTKPLILSFITHQFLIVSTAQVAELAPDLVATSQLTACGVNCQPHWLQLHTTCVYSLYGLYPFSSSS